MGRSADGFPVDTLAILRTQEWLLALAAPRVYCALERPVDKAVLLHLLDIWVAYADRGDYYLLDHVPDPDRPALARKLRVLIDAWTLPELPAEITETARELLRAEGYDEPPNGAATWDDYTFDPDEPVASQLVWAEDLPKLVAKVATPEEVEARNVERSKQIAEWEASQPPYDLDRGEVQLIYGDSWNNASIAAFRVLPSRTGALPQGADHGDLHAIIMWLMVLASPPLFRTLRRMPDRDHLLHLLDTFVAYAARNDHVVHVKWSPRRWVRHSEREALARKLREILATWTPPELPQEITDTARELVEAEGMRPPEGGWDNLEHDKPYPLEDVLSWPEGIPVVLRALQGAGAG
jgi:hypothetical protein